MTRVNVRRGLAVVVALAATLAIYLLLVREDAGEGRGGSRTGLDEVPAPVRDLVAEMTVEQKVDGILMVGFEGTDASAPIVAELSERQLGGVIVRGDNWIDAFSGEALISELRAAAESGGDVPPLVATPQEGGEYRALADLPPESRQLDVGDEGSAEVALAWARETGSALSEAGFDMNLAPVADVATLDSPVADRAFSDDPGVVAAMTPAAIRGCIEAGIACVPRHFPGLGAASSSTDEGPATVSVDRATLLSRDLPPFEAAIAAGAPAVILSHAFYAPYDPVTPASLSPAVADRLLRDDLGFTGVAMTDDLATGAIRATGSVPRAAIGALGAGADMLLIEDPAEAADAREALIEAVSSGEVDESRLDQAVGRVLDLKRRFGLIE